MAERVEIVIESAPRPDTPEGERAWSAKYFGTHWYRLADALGMCGAVSFGEVVDEAIRRLAAEDGR